MQPTPCNLSPAPGRRHDCCVGLSERFVDFLRDQTGLSILGNESKATILSIGSGSGLLEVLLQRALEKQDTGRIQVEGVEVHSPAPVNKYLHGPTIHVVNGTWELCDRAFQEDVKMWFFIYPRQPQLVRRYFERLNDADTGSESKRQGVVAVIWAGPEGDWVDYEEIFQYKMGWMVKKVAAEEAGVSAWETVAIMRKVAPKSLK